MNDINVSQSQSNNQGNEDNTGRSTTTTYNTAKKAGIAGAIVAGIIALYQAGMLDRFLPGEPDPVEQVPVEVETLPAPDVGARMPPPPPPAGPSPDACPICGLKIKHFPKGLNGSTKLVLGTDCDGDGWGEIICGPCAVAELPYPNLAGL